MATSECYVYLQLPRSLEVVTCGVFRHSADASGVARGEFVYRNQYRERPDAVALDPRELPLRAGAFETVRLGGMFGALRDASPDAWGRLVIDKRTRASGHGELDYLLLSPDDRAGALSFGRTVEPAGAAAAFNPVVRLSALLKAAQAIERQVPSEQLAQLLDPRTSMGGARPKNVVEDTRGLWLAKFPSRGDRWNVCGAEAAMLALARECGIDAVEPRLVKAGAKTVLLVPRFDRARVKGGYLRHRVISALTLLQAEDSPLDRRRWSYLELADELRRTVPKPAKALAELFRRMVFNALISNTDDHPRNHALVARGESWELAPAYDLNPSAGVSLDRRDLAMVCGDLGRWANRNNLLSGCERFGLSRRGAGRVIDALKKRVVRRWEPLAGEAGVSKSDRAALQGAFAYPGFEHDK